MKIFKVVPYRKDAKLSLFCCQKGHGKQLLKDLCCNAITGYVREIADGNVAIPNFVAEKIADYLQGRGDWKKVEAADFSY